MWSCCCSCPILAAPAQHMSAYVSIRQHASRMRVKLLIYICGAAATHTLSSPPSAPREPAITKKHPYSVWPHTVIYVASYCCVRVLIPYYLLRSRLENPQYPIPHPFHHCKRPHRVCQFLRVHVRCRDPLVSICTFVLVKRVKRVTCGDL